MSKSKPFPIPADYPFKADIEQYQASLKTSYDSVSVKRTTVTEEITYTNNPNGLYAKLFQNKKLLDLSASACLVVVYICCHLKHRETMIQIPLRDIGLSKVTFYKALLELTHINVIRKVPGKKEMYWINVTMVANGDTRETELKLLNGAEG